MFALQPANVRAQIESAAVWGVSALRERLIFKDGMPQQSNFHDYPVLRMADVPKITTKVLVTDNKPGGIGEAGLPPSRRQWRTPSTSSPASGCATCRSRPSC